MADDEKFKERIIEDARVCFDTKDVKVKKYSCRRSGAREETVGDKIRAAMAKAA